MKIIQNRKIYFIVSGVFVGASIAAFLIFGLKPGIDFTGGSLLEIEIKEGANLSAGQISDLLTKGENAVLPGVAAQSAGANGFILRFKDISEEEHQKILGILRQKLAGDNPAASSQGSGGEHNQDKQTQAGAGPAPGVSIGATDLSGNPVDVRVEDAPLLESGTTVIAGEDLLMEKSFQSIGPIVGRELKRKAIYAVFGVLLGIILFIAWSFRKVSRPVSSWKYGLTAIVALGHDVTIPIGVFAVLGKFYGVEVDILFVTALLTILGYSVNDTIIVFDRTRENLSRHIGADFEDTVNRSVNETIARSIYTSATVLLVLLAIFFFGGQSVHYFSLALIIGVVFGTYSSIFLASPLLVEWERWSRRRG